MFGLVYGTALAALAAWLAWAVIGAVIGLRRNIKAARESGLRICGTPELFMGSGRAVEDIALRVVFMSKELVLLGNFHWLWLSVYILCMDTFSSEFAGWRGAACLPPVMGADCKLTTMCISTAHFIASMTWLPLSFVLMPIYRSLPSAWTDPWLRTLDPIWSYRELYAPFARYGDVFLVATPGGCYMGNASPTVIHQIATRRTEWVKPIEHYGVVEHFGPNVVSTEGSTWRDHRRVSNASFNERSNAVVWKESIRQAGEMVKAWGGRVGNSQEVMWIADVYPDAATASLHIISRSGFGVKLLWPGEEQVEGEVEEGYEKFSSHEPMGAHTMTFKESLHTMLRDFVWMGVFSKSTLKKLPFKRTKVVWEGYANLDTYLHELLDVKKAAIAAGLAEKDALDLMVPLITASDSLPTDHHKNVPQIPTPIGTPQILGNAFIFLFAGHETTANSLTFLLIFLALNLPAQRRLQHTLDALLASLPPDPAQWPYPSTFHKLGNSYLGACINEQLRLITSVTMVPKRSVGPQTLVLDDGKVVKVPADTFQHFCAPSVHRNPSAWPHVKSSSRTPGKTNDLDDFVPERWILEDETYHPHQASSSSNVKPNNGNNDNNTSAQDPDALDIGAATLFRPAPGAFIPFSDGPRACLGRRFAMVELVAVIATLMRGYSVELDVREWVRGHEGKAEETLKGMGMVEKEEVYGKASKRAWEVLEGELGGLVTLQCVGRKVGVRVCQRGREVFGGLV
ncbi:MAG: hypothetical protein LQ349_000284 [Xanthoria aureola]|nr:MAG: hypothetical protein LQ349_000284 [Xanthoria aureola]